ncbi:hypothetical protein L207DRAFT_345864 [Hyaloscypha variabilis F]|uniref:Uncharacterized protein n=1 Tax=Hyaloscypha variabilis (strain UAMH 11265 / GT02V1 / F) TaxID=1149755 RepID=A0A2J6RQL5_HYAVF|nr:hypothetical protein L207DRAFT_345864 [Hyaloscypha variabilis F]
MWKCEYIGVNRESYSTLSTAIARSVEPQTRSNSVMGNYPQQSRSDIVETSQSSWKADPNSWISSERNQHAEIGSGLPNKCLLAGQTTINWVGTRVGLSYSATPKPESRRRLSMLRSTISTQISRRGRARVCKAIALLAVRLSMRVLPRRCTVSACFFYAS